MDIPPLILLVVMVMVSVVVTISAATSVLVFPRILFLPSVLLENITPGIRNTLLQDLSSFEFFYYVVGNMDPIVRILKRNSM